MLKVVIIGYGEMFTNLIAGALDANCKIVGVLRKDTIKYHPVVKWFRDIINPSVEHNYIKSYKLPEIKTPKGINSEKFKKELLKLNPDIILVGSWGEKFPMEIYSLPKIATINAHPSLLPKYRGPNPYFWVIKNGETTSGVTFHLVTDNYDSGAILAQEEITIYPSDTGKSLKQRTVLTARGVVCELLKDLSEDVIIPLQQREEKATYYSHPEGLELDFKKTSQELYATIRGAYPWHECYFYHDITAMTPNPEGTSIIENETSYTTAGTVAYADSKTKTISIVCGDGKVLQMRNINLLKKQDRFFTSNYISREIVEGNIII